MGDLMLRGVVVGPVQTNCYLLMNRNTKEVVIVDPGEEAERISRAIVRMEGKPVAVLLTHGHFDHIMAADELRSEYGISVYAPKEEEDVLKEPHLNQSTGFMRQRVSVKVDVLLDDLEMVELAGFQIQMIHTPGHTKGSSCYYLKDEKVLLSGDTIFCESCGRCDLPTGNFAKEQQSLQKIILNLPEDVEVYPGHGESTSIGHEKKYNPYL